MVDHNEEKGGEHLGDSGEAMLKLKDELKDEKEVHLHIAQPGC